MWRPMAPTARTTWTPSASASRWTGNARPFPPRPCGGMGAIPPPFCAPCAFLRAPRLKFMLMAQRRGRCRAPCSRRGGMADDLISLSFIIEPQRPTDLPLVEDLLDRAFGPDRHGRTAYRLRDGVEPVAELSLVARDDSRFLGT